MGQTVVQATKAGQVCPVAVGAAAGEELRLLAGEVQEPRVAVAEVAGRSEREREPPRSTLPVADEAARMAGQEAVVGLAGLWAEREEVAEQRQ